MAERLAKGQRPKSGRSTRVNAAVTEMRAQWLYDRRCARPTLSMVELLREVRARFGCGKTAAEQAYKRCNEIMQTEWSSPERKKAAETMVLRKFAEIAETAERRGELRVASATWDRYRRMAGLGAADRMEHSGDAALLDAMANVSDDKLAELLASMGINASEHED